MNPRLRTRVTPNGTLMMKCQQDASDHYQRVLMLTGAPSAWFQRTTNLVSSGLIIDLSAPVGGSVNKGIDLNLTSLTYPRVEDAVRLIKAAGPGALMAKLDLKAAYRHVPVHLNNQSLLTIRWGDTTYLDTALPFSLCSAPKLFTAMADGLAWCIVCEGSLVHGL